MTRGAMAELRGKRVLVMGLGVHGGGLGVARFLVEQGADVTVTDLRTAEQLQPTLDQLGELPVRYVLGEHHEADFRQADMVVRNPGVPRESRYLQIARAAGAAIEMEMTLFFRLCPGPIIGITGTKGKTTTTLLTGAMLRQQHPDTVVAGNLRISALEQLPKVGRDTPVVLELSSWQLEGLGEAKLSPQYACFLNLSPDHLDRYGSMADYAEAKAQIFLHQGQADTVIFNADDPLVRGMSARARGKVGWFRGPAASLEAKPAPVVERGTQSMATWQADTLVWQDGAVVETICHRSDIKLVGEHNRANVAAAAALAKAFGAETERIRNAITNFTGVSDRMEDVRTVDGVRYINDTTATAPAAAIAALRSLDVPAIVIAGGADKQLAFDDLAQTLVERAKAIVLLQGTATPRLQAALADVLRCSDRQPWISEPQPALKPAVEAAREHAAPGDVVLLSPGCASFGMFRNEFDRGEQFRQIVRALP